MITDADVKKLKDSFKDTFATKDDLKGVAKQKDLVSLQKDVSALKTDVKRVEKKMDEFSEYVIPALGNIFKWTDNIHKALIGKPSRTINEN